MLREVMAQSLQIVNHSNGLLSRKPIGHPLIILLLYINAVQCRLWFSLICRRSSWTWHCGVTQKSVAIGDEDDIIIWNSL